MALLGIDFGTTNTVVALHDRGSFPVIQHSIQTRIGRINYEVFPSTIYFSKRTDRFTFGLEAERVSQQLSADEGIEIRSLKRHLARYVEGMEVGGAERFRVRDLFVGFLGALRESILASGQFSKGEPLEAIVTWPAHSNGAQRIITRDAFREAGFEVVGSINEPTAAAIEYADRATGGNPRVARGFSETVAIFDFGGGTFDASLLVITKGVYQVLDTMGLEALGGDDLDKPLAEMFAERLGAPLDTLTHNQQALLTNIARAQKESLGTRASSSLFLNPRDLGLGQAPIHVVADEYIERIRPLVKQTVDRLAELIDRSVATGQIESPMAIDAIYLVGGSSRLPLVQQLVGERFPKTRVVASSKPFSSIAVGAAVSSLRRVEVRDIFSRHFGLYRLRDSGQREYFHTIFEAGTHLPHKGQPCIEKVEVYSPRHNIGHLRFLEASELDSAGLPKGRVREWSDILFPYDPLLSVEAEVGTGAIRATESLADMQVEEWYRCDSDGIITVEVSRAADGKRRRFEIYRD